MDASDPIPPQKALVPRGPSTYGSRVALRLPGTTWGERRDLAFSRHGCVRVIQITRPRNRRGRREGRVPTAPMARVQQKHAVEPQVQADHPAFPARWFYGLYVIFPVTGLVATVACGSSRKLSACIGAPEPHDFAVRTNAARRARIAPGDVRPSHPAPNVRDDREPPLLWVRDKREHRFDLPDNAMPGTCDRLARRAK